MPMQNGKYVSPTWVNGQAPALSATELNAMTQTIENNQVATVSISLPANGWSASGDNFTQVVTIAGAGANSKIDLQPDAATIAALIEAGTLGLYIQNNNGVFTAYAIAAAPTTALTIQATITEVV